MSSTNNPHPTAAERPHHDARESGARVSPDRTWVGIAAIILVLSVMLASMVFSFTAITEAAAWTSNPQWSWWLAAFFIDGAIVTFTLSMVVFRWRGQDTKRTVLMLIGFTVLSSTLNVIHAGTGWDWDLSRMEAWAGMAIAGAAPFAALLAAEEVTRLTFVRRTDPEPEELAVTEPVVEPVPELAHPVLEIPRQRPAPRLTFQTQN